jgi:hypothetical protein
MPTVDKCSAEASLRLKEQSTDNLLVSSDSTTPSWVNRQRTTPLSYNPRSGLSNTGSDQEVSLDSDSDSKELGAPNQSNTQTSNPNRSKLNRELPFPPLYTAPTRKNSNLNRVQHQVQHSHTLKDLQHPKGATDDTSTKGSAALYAKKSQDVQVFPGHHPEDGQQDKQSTSQVSGYGVRLGAVGNLMSSLIRTAPPTKEKYQQLKEDFYRLRDDYRQSRTTIDNYDRELRRRGGELQKASQFISHLEHVSQQSKDTINGLQNELTNVYQQLKDARTLSEVRGKKLFGAQVDILSISEVG